MACFRGQHDRACNLLLFFVLVSLVAFSFFVYFYAHLHVLPSGQIVVHSHAQPQSEKRHGSHSHSNLELFQLDQFSKIETTLFAIVFVLGFFVFFKRVRYSYRSIRSFSYNSHFSHRAPPLFSA